jgi:hypothetical protein
MPLQKLQFRSGINRENTNYAGEGGWFAGDKIRFRSGYPEKIGGWQNFAATVSGAASTYKGVCRALWNWITLNSSNLLGVGTEQKLYVENGGVYYDITPIRSTATINADPFATVSGSKLVTVTDTAHGAVVGTYVTYSGVPNYLDLPGAVGDYASTPDSAAVSITGDIDLRLKMEAADWTPTVANYLISKAVTSGQYAYNFGLGAAGTIFIRVSTDGTTFITGTSTVATGFVDGTTNWVRVTRAAGTGAINFYTSADGIAWAALGAPVAAAAGSMYDGTDALAVGAHPNGLAPLDGKIYYAEIRDGIAGTVVAVFDANDGTSGSTSVTSSATGEVWTIHGLATLDGVGGIAISGEFEIIRVIDANSYDIASTTAATSTGSGGGAVVSAEYQINAGGSTSTSGTGWGIGPWSRDGWGEEFSGTAVVTDTSQLRLWSLDSYGQDLVAAIRGGTIYYWAADTTTAPPRAVTLKSLAQAAGYDETFVPNTVYELHTSGVQRFSIAIGANPYDPLDADTDFDPMLVRWSDQEDIYQWVPAADNQAGELRLSHGSRLVTGRHGRQEFVVWSDSAIYSMQYLGPPYVWGLNLLMDGISIVSPYAVIGSSNIMFWMGVDKFYMYDGRVQTLPCTVRQYVFDSFNTDQAFQVVAGSSEQFSEVWWHYPSLNSTVNDRYVIFNYLDNVWYYGTLGRSAWLDSALRPKPMGAFSVKNSYLSADITASATTVNVLDAETYPASGVVQIESEKIAYSGVSATSLLNCTRGYANTTAATHLAYTYVLFSVPNQVMFHETGNDDLSLPEAVAVEAYVSSSDFDIGDGHNFGFVWRILPDLTFDSSTTPAPGYPSVTMICKPRQNSGTAYGAESAPTVSSAQSYASERVYVVQQYTGQVMTRVRGRQMSFEIRSTGLGVAWQLGVPRIDIRPDGRKS